MHNNKLKKIISIKYQFVSDLHNYKSLRNIKSEKYINFISIKLYYNKFLLDYVGRL